MRQGSGLGAEVSLKDFRKDILIEVYNEAGQLALTYKVYRCWVSEFQAQADLDAGRLVAPLQIATAVDFAYNVHTDVGNHCVGTKINSEFMPLSTPLKNGDRVEILLDGGVRNGVDVLKAVALGARGVLIGRPWVWATAGAGQQGLDDLLGTFRRELQTAMALTGVARVQDIGPDTIDA